MEKPKTKYFLYARKSSESEDRQVQSIDDQVDRLTKLAAEHGFEIAEVITESKSAKKPGNRPLFDSMMDRVEKGEANGILCWQINRLSRNPIDSGRIQWMLQRSIIQSIQTIDREYKPEDNTLLFSIESSMATQYLLELSKVVKRGLQSKLDKGQKPGNAPTGYINNVVEHTIETDPERFALIRKAWDLMLTGNYTVPQVLHKLNDEWGFIGIKKRRSGGNPLALSGLYRIFSNLFYAGIIVQKNEQYPGNHEPMVTLEEYDHVQVLLGRKGKPRPKTHAFAFTGMIRCGDCGCMVTADTRTKPVKGSGFKNYTYYHCTHRKVTARCGQKGGILVEDLEAQIEKEIMGLTILPEFRQWALECLNDKNDREIDDRTKVYESQHRALLEAQGNLDSLTKMRYRELIDDVTYLREKAPLTDKIAQLTTQLRETEGRAETWLELSEKVFDFALYAHKAFLVGDVHTKKEILAALGSNFILKDRKLTITYESYLEPIIQHYPALQSEYERLELSKTLATKAKTAELTAVIARWRDVVWDVRTVIQYSKSYIYIPTLV